jgi:hypothetical protein
VVTWSTRTKAALSPELKCLIHSKVEYEINVDTLVHIKFRNNFLNSAIPETRR